MSISVDAGRFSPANMVGLMPRVAEMALVIVIAWVASGWFTAEGGPTPLPQRVGGGESLPVPSAQAIAAVPLFGKAAAAATAPAAKPAAPSRLSIRLLGTVVAGKSSAAVLSLRPGAEQKVFFLGNTVQPGVTLKTVEPEAIVVDNHGRMERIAMAKFSLPGGQPATIDGGTIDGGSGESHIQISRASLDAQLQDLSMLLTQAKAIPHQMDGKPDGVMIDDIVPGSFYDKAGLKNLDVIRKINGNPVTRMEQSVQMFQTLKGQDNIDIEIARAGSVRHLHYTIH